jgi:hypothetical protein
VSVAKNIILLPYPLLPLPKEKPPFRSIVTIRKVFSVQAHALKPVRAANLVPEGDPFVQLVNKFDFKSRTKGTKGFVNLEPLKRDR